MREPLNWIVQSLMLAVSASPLCYHSVCCTRSCTSVHSERHHRILQYTSCLDRKAWLALYPEGADTLCQASNRLLRNQRQRNDCERFIPPRGCAYEQVCCQVVAAFESLYMRLLGISLASFSSGMYRISQNPLVLDLSWYDRTG